MSSADPMEPAAGPAPRPAGGTSPPAGTAAAPASPALATRQLAAGYGDVPVIHGVDLEVRAGQLVAVVGPNGAGKSTLLKAILGLARIMGGQVLADGNEVTGRPLEELVRLGVGYVPQVDDVFDPLKVSENLNMGGYLLGKDERATRMEEVLAIFPALRSRLNRYVGTMSGGERKMTAIARALMMSPRVLILDEPTAGLSAALTEAVLNDQVRTLADHGHAVLLVEQKAQAALRLADGISLERELYKWRQAPEDAREAAQALAQKRPPQWKGRCIRFPVSAGQDQCTAIDRLPAGPQGLAAP